MIAILICIILIAVVLAAIIQEIKELKHQQSNTNKRQQNYAEAFQHNDNVLCDGVNKAAQDIKAEQDCRMRDSWSLSRRMARIENQSAAASAEKRKKGVSNDPGR